MASRIKIDQAGLPAGVAGVSRTDGLATGALVTLTNVGAEGVTQFRLLWGPPNDTTAESSLAATGDPDVWTFSPTAACYGSYLIALFENGVELERRVFGVRTPNRKLLIPALNEQASRQASWTNDGPDQQELSQNNATDFTDPYLNGLNYAGWWRSQQELYLALEAESPDIPGLSVLVRDLPTPGKAAPITATAARQVLRVNEVFSQLSWGAPMLFHTDGAYIADIHTL